MTEYLWSKGLNKIDFMDAELCDDGDDTVYYIIEMKLAPFFQTHHIYVEIYLYGVSQCLNPQPNPRFDTPRGKLLKILCEEEPML